MYVYTGNLTCDDIFECSFKAQSSKLKRLFSLKRGKRDVLETAFELVVSSGIGRTSFPKFAAV